MTTPNPNEPDTAHAGQEPPGWLLDRIEACTGVALGPRCPHCQQTVQSLAGPGMSVEVIHEPGCPALIAAENPPAIIGYPYPDDPRTPL
ncbi:hypothetical protein B1A87_004170 [Arthrobacter sp. KBS0703]|uniref:hypothetical protein n=1 Tax=Arthrobacter sp. KBS0703 TaxID=1955698 RepID=UPI00098F1F02|nr:hypothetical protein [Arthrobacter sp. KBS0703]TSE15238.1 hypothetical protein B1A87_004170 [Arthrobacter sp. KBS0703]